MPFYRPPLDYSFKELADVRDVPKEPPQQGTVKGAGGRGEAKGAAGPAVDRHGASRLNAVAVRLNNNRISTLEGLDEVLEQILDDPQQLRWLDLSWNHLTTIEPVLFKYPNISVLYLHGNRIDRLAETKKLADLKNLRKLTLHSNPIDQDPYYRIHVLQSCKLLRSLDVSGVTQRNREYAEKVKVRTRRPASRTTLL